MSDLNAIFSALGDPTRRAILSMLTRGETSLSGIAAQFDMSLTGVSGHVKVLEAANLLTVTKRGRTRYCHMRPSTIKEAFDWLSYYEQFWAVRLEDLATHLGDDE